MSSFKLPKVSRSFLKPSWERILFYGKHAVDKALSDQDADFAQHGCARLVVSKQEGKYHATLSASGFGVKGEHVGETRQAAIEGAALDFKGLVLVVWSSELAMA